MPRILLALLGMAFCAVASAATVEKLTIDGKAVTVKVPTQSQGLPGAACVGTFTVTAFPSMVSFSTVAAEATAQKAIPSRARRMRGIAGIYVQRCKVVKVGLTTLGQPRLSEGAQPYLRQPQHPFRSPVSP